MSGPRLGVCYYPEHWAGLKIVLCTLTAWLILKSPDILPVDKSGVVQGFGSRRHYSFSSAD